MLRHLYLEKSASSPNSNPEKSNLSLGACRNYGRDCWLGNSCGAGAAGSYVFIDRRTRSDDVPDGRTHRWPARIGYRSQKFSPALELRIIGMFDAFWCATKSSGHARCIVCNHVERVRYRVRRISLGLPLTHAPIISSSKPGLNCSVVPFS
jgi:hypothetical protein